MPDRSYTVYILASLSRRLYIGVTNDLGRRILEHRERRADAFTTRYRITRLVYFEQTSDVIAAIAREKELKSWRRDRKMALIESVNAGWHDLAEHLGHPERSEGSRQPSIEAGLDPSLRSG
jgi:putative endonuclease